MIRYLLPIASLSSATTKIRDNHERTGMSAQKKFTPSEGWNALLIFLNTLETAFFDVISSQGHETGVFVSNWCDEP
jgi:hypothetical protein